jgi:hypothetical protein
MAKCEFTRPFEDTIDVKTLTIGSEILYHTGFKVYKNPGVNVTMAEGFSQEFTYIVTDRAYSLYLGLLSSVIGISIIMILS